MVGRYLLDSIHGDVLFVVSQRDCKYSLQIEFRSTPTPMLINIVEAENENLVVTTTSFEEPDKNKKMFLSSAGKDLHIKGEHVFIGEIDAVAKAFLGKTRADIMDEELDKKRTNKVVNRSRAEIDSEVEKLLSQMTLAEKIGQMTETMGEFSDLVGASIEGSELSDNERIRQGMVGSVNSIDTLPIIFEAQKIAVEDSRLGIPLLFCQDVIHGKDTIFPIPLAWACSFNPSLVQKAARISAKEASSMGVMYTMSPMVDIARDPRWGRISEGSGEDPYLSSLMSVALVKGYQGDNLYAEDTMLATLKHFIGYGAAEAGRDYNSVEISETTLRNVYLPPFREGIKAGAASIMNSFNVIDGIPMAVNKRLLNDLLRDELEFEGIIISDYAAIEEVVVHGVAEDSKEAAYMAINATMDIEMATTVYERSLATLVANGKIDESLIDAAVKRILRFKYELGIMDDPYRYFRPDDAEKAFCDEYLQFSRELAQQSVVLLKNSNNTLPFDKAAKIALIGPKGNSKDMLGTWQFSSRAGETITLKQGLENAGCPVIFETGCDVNMPIDGGIADAKAAAGSADIIILALGEDSAMSGEAASRQNITIPEPQIELAKEMKALGKPTVLVLTNGRPLLLEWFDENVDAILEGWFLGSQAGNALADVLTGAFNPCGKLSVTFPRHTGQIPIYYNHLNTGRPYVTGDTDKFKSCYIDGPSTPLYPFGYGLSYTSFVISSLRLSASKMDRNGSITVSVDLTNIGKTKGTEVVQLYLHDMVASIARPVKELKSFERVNLEPGKSRTISFAITESMLRFYNAEGKEVSEAGTFEVLIGSSSCDKNLLKDSFRLI